MLAERRWDDQLALLRAVGELRKAGHLLAERQEQLEWTVAVEVGLAGHSDVVQERWSLVSVSLELTVGWEEVVQQRTTWARRAQELAGVVWTRH